MLVPFEEFNISGRLLAQLRTLNVEVPLDLLSLIYKDDERLRKYTKVEKVEIIANCFEDDKQRKTIVFSITDENELTAFVLIATNEESNTNEVITGYPIVQSTNIIQLKIKEIKEWENLIEAVILGETEDGNSISFFDTKYFTQKDNYKVGGTYNFTISALCYNVEILKEKSFSFEGQDAINWLAKSGQNPSYDEQANLEPIVFDLTNLVAFLPTNEDYPDDVEFQSPINTIETVKAFNNEYYKMGITIFRDPDIKIDVFAKTNFFDTKPQTKDAIRGFIWLQGYL